MNQRIIKPLVLASLLILLSACNHKTLPVSTIYSSNQCAIAERKMSPVTSIKELAEIIQAKPRQFNEKPQALPEVDFTNQSLIVLALGHKPSAGYSINLNRKTAVLQGNKLHLSVSFKAPDANSIQAQVITSPCKVLSLPKVEYSEIVLDSAVKP